MRVDLHSLAMRQSGWLESPALVKPQVSILGKTFLLLPDPVPVATQRQFTRTGRWRWCWKEADRLPFPSSFSLPFPSSFSFGPPTFFCSRRRKSRLMGKEQGWTQESGWGSTPWDSQNSILPTQGNKSSPPYITVSFCWSTFDGVFSSQPYAKVSEKFIYILRTWQSIIDCETSLDLPILVCFT